MGNCIKAEQNIKVHGKENTTPKQQPKIVRDSSRQNTATSLEDFIKAKYAHKLKDKMK